MNRMRILMLKTRALVSLLVPDLVRDGRRTSILTLSVALTVGLLIPMQLLGGVTGHSIEESGSQILGADLVVNVGHLSDTAMVEKAREVIADAGGDSQDVYTTSVVASSGPGKEALLSLKFVDPKVYPYYLPPGYKSPSAIGVSGMQSVLLSPSGFRALGMRKNGEVHVNQLLLDVAGKIPDDLVSLANYASEGVLVADRTTLETFKASGSYDISRQLVARLPRNTYESTILELRSLVGKDQVVSSREVGEVFEQSAHRLALVYAFVASAAIVLAGLGVAALSHSWVMSRYTDIGILRANGYLPGHIGLIIAIRFLIISMLASFLSPILGIPLGYMVLSVLGYGSLYLSILDLRAFAELLVWSAVFVMGFSMESFITALKIPAVALLRGPEASAPHVRRRPWYFVAAALFGAIACSVAAARFTGETSIAVIVVSFVVILELVFFGMGTVVANVLGRILQMTKGTRLNGMVLVAHRSAIARDLAIVATVIALSAAGLATRSAVTWDLQERVRRDVGFEVLGIDVPTDGKWRSGAEEALERAAPGSSIVGMSVFQANVRMIDGVRLSRPFDLAIKVVDGQDLPKYPANVSDGRYIAVGDAGKHTAVVWEGYFSNQVAIGSTLTISFNQVEEQYRVIGLEGSPGMRFGLLVPVTLSDIPEGAQLRPISNVLGVSCAPGQSRVVTQQLKTIAPNSRVYDFGAVEFLLRSVVDGMSIVFLVMSLAALAIGLIVCTAHAQLERQQMVFETVMFRVFGCYGRAIWAQHLAEAVIMGVAGAFIGANAGRWLIFRLLGLVVQAPPAVDWTFIAAVSTVSGAAMITIRFVPLLGWLRRPVIPLLRNE